jgi:magnesium transporter
MGSITTRTYSGTGPADRATGLDGAVAATAAGDGVVVWIDVTDADPSDLEQLADHLGLHHLAVEDAAGPHQRDKYVHYDDHRFVVAHSASIDGDMDLTLTEFDVFVGDRWIVTVHRGGDEVMELMFHRWDQVRDLAGCHLGVALYAVLDRIAAGYADVLDRFESFYDDAADRVFGEEQVGPAEHRQKFETRTALDRFTRTVDSLAEAVAALVDDDCEHYGAARPYLIDVKSDLSRLVVELDGMSALVGQLLDADLLLRDHRQNVVMKKVTSWAAIIAVPTLVTGYYGMNVPFPGEDEVWGVATSSVLAVGCAGALYTLFRSKEWL